MLNLWETTGDLRRGPATPKLVIPVWRCLYKVLPTSFFDQVILLLRLLLINLQWSPGPSRINGKYWHLGSLTNWLQFISWDHLLPLHFFLKGTSFASGIPGYCLCPKHTLQVHMSLFRQALSLTAPSPSSNYTPIICLLEGWRTKFMHVYSP